MNFQTVTPQALEQLLTDSNIVKFRLSKTSTKNAQVQFINVNINGSPVQLIVKDQKTLFQISSINSSERPREGTDCNINFNGGREGDPKTELFTSMEKLQQINTTFVERSIDFGKALTSAVSIAEAKRNAKIAEVVEEYKDIKIVIVDKAHFNKFKDQLGTINRSYGLQVVFNKSLSLFSLATNSADGKYSTTKFKIKTTGVSQTQIEYQELDGSYTRVNFDEKNIHEVVKKNSVVRFVWGPPAICLSAAGISVMYGTIKQLVIIKQKQNNSSGFDLLRDAPTAAAAATAATAAAAATAATAAPAAAAAATSGDVATTVDAEDSVAESVTRLNVAKQEDSLIDDFEGL